MNKVEVILGIVERLLNTKRKRHIVGGILMSVSMFVCGLTFTVITLKEDDKSGK